MGYDVMVVFVSHERLCYPLRASLRDRYTDGTLMGC